MKDGQIVLIVDDASENVDLLVNLLKDYDLVTALDGETALKIVDEENVDLILLDIMMPGMDGFEVCKILKSNVKTTHIPIIFLSAKDKHQDIQKGFELGAVDYVTKPFNPNELLSRANTHLKLRAYEKNLEKRVEQELERNRLKQQMIHQQSKQAALGELLMHIAHQWKQPLASLGSINLQHRVKLENGLTPSRDEFIDSIDKSEELINYMSNTIDTFKNFYKPSFNSEDFFISETILDVLSIVEATFNFDNIRIFIDTHEDETSFANVNEFSQVVISILNNARDIFKNRLIKEPKIYIEIENKKISISDNGGGIKEELLEDIFLPFVSTNNGSGIGLYLSKNIVEKNNAVLSVQNYKDGTKFNIEFITWMD